MKSSSKLTALALLALLTSVNFQFSTVHAQGTAFTYQGRLNDGGSPANGIYDFRFTIHDSVTGGSVVGGPITDSSVAVTNGLFTTTLDFGSGVFDGTSYWLQIAVRTNGAAFFSLLSPRQEVTPSPYSITAANVVNGGLPGTYSSPVTFNNSGNSFSGSGAGLTSLDAGSLASGTVPEARLGANVALLDRNQTFTGDETFAGRLNLTAPTADIYSGSQTVLLSDGSKYNFFAGLNAGNATMSGTGNTASGQNALLSNTSGYANTAQGAYALFYNTSGHENTALGYDALNLNSSGYNNTASGVDALTANMDGYDNTASGAYALYSNTNGYDNTACGFDALYHNGNGMDNTANGANALFANSYGDYNTANGMEALRDNTGGNYNTASGYQALSANMTGAGNTASGAIALHENEIGNDNTATGFGALYANADGAGNTASGSGALSMNTSGNYNTASGYDALAANTNGSFNTVIGSGALQYSKDGSDNTVLGYQALISAEHSSYNTAIGVGALGNSTTNGGSNTAIGVGALSNTSGQNNIALGIDAGRFVTTGSDNIDIGNHAYASDTSTIRIGAYETTTFIAGIEGATIPAGSPVYVGSGGQLGTVTSSQRFKQGIQTMGDASDVLYSLRPVTFQYKPDIDPAGTPEFGLVAEQVEKVDPALIVRDKEGKPYSVRYQAINAMLLNEFLKEHRTVETQGHELQKQGDEIRQLRQTVDKLKAMVFSQAGSEPDDSLKRRLHP